MTNVSGTPAICRVINATLTTAHSLTADHMTVDTVESCLKVVVIWIVMFVFTLVQSRTYVDTVQNVLHKLVNSRHICWSHTMKVLGSHVAFVRRNSPGVATLSNIYIVMKSWSRMFAVNVQSISRQQVNWNIMHWDTWMSNYSAVVCAVKITNISRMFQDISRDVLSNWHLVMYNLYIC